MVYNIVKNKGKGRATMKIFTIFTRKSYDYEDLKANTKILEGTLQEEADEYEIAKTIELSKEEWDLFKEELLRDRDYLRNQKGILLVKEKGKSNNSGIVAITSGYDYARYTGLPIKKTQVRKCPHCGAYYTQRPALSRLDNKTEICPKCGKEEAVLQFIQHIKEEE